MIALKPISDPDGTPPADGDWILIERIGAKYIANGATGGKMLATFFKPDPFDSAEAAIKACSIWFCGRRPDRLRGRLLSFVGPRV